MKEDRERSSCDDGPGPSIGGRTVEAIRELLSRRGLSPKTIALYVAVLGRAEAFCCVEGLSLDDIRRGDLDRFVATLPQSRSSLSQARAALSHYWAAVGRLGAPAVQVTQIAGRMTRDPTEGFASLERSRAVEQLAGAEQPTWCEMGYEREWLLNRLRARQLNRKTALDYLAKLTRIARWCEAEGTTIDTVTASELEAFSELIPMRRSSRAGLKNSLSHYFAITGRPDPPLWSIRVPRKPRMMCRALEDDDARRLEAAAIARDDRKGLAVVIGLYLGLRRFEIAQLKWSDFEDGWVHIVGKFDQEASLPVHPAVADYLGRQRNPTPFVFPGRPGKRGSVNPTTLWGWVKDVAAEAGVSNVATHVLRHTALATGNDATGDLRSVQDFARHAEPTTTSGYTRTTKRRIVAVSDAIGEFYGRPHSASGPEVRAPMVSFDWVVRTFEGEHAVGPWLELASLFHERPGWGLRSEGNGEPFFDFRYGDGKLSVSIHPFTNARPPIFSVTREVGPTAEDIVCWDLGDVGILEALLSTFEAGGVPFPPTHSHVGIAGESTFP